MKMIKHNHFICHYYCYFLWVESQCVRVGILFREYLVKKAYYFSMKFHAVTLSGNNKLL